VALGLVIAEVSLRSPWRRASSPSRPDLAAFVWSEMGTRERRYGTAPLLFSTPRPLGRPLAAGWLAGAALALLLVAPVVVRSLIVGQAPAALALVIGAGFVPALAMAAGSLTGGRKLFEVLYLLLWYVGPLNQVASLTTPEPPPRPPGADARPGAVAAGLLLVVAWAARKRALKPEPVRAFAASVGAVCLAARPWRTP
jgi:hypothetical protein